MPITSKMFPHENLTIFTGEGKISFSEASETIRSFSKSINPGPTKNVLWDLRKSSVASLTASQVTYLADLSNIDSEERSGGKTAIVATQDQNFGIAKEFKGQTMHIQREFVVFRHLDEAKKWLEE